MLLDSSSEHRYPDNHESRHLGNDLTAAGLGIKPLAGCCDALGIMRAERPTEL